jgi:hypothetical protein
VIIDSAAILQFHPLLELLLQTDMKNGIKINIDRGCIHFIFPIEPLNGGVRQIFAHFGV